MAYLQPLASAVAELMPTKFCTAMVWLESVYNQCISGEWELSVNAFLHYKWHLQSPLTLNGILRHSKRITDNHTWTVTQVEEWRILCFRSALLHDNFPVRSWFLHSPSWLQDVYYPSGVFCHLLLNLFNTQVPLVTDQEPGIVKAITSCLPHVDTPPWMEPPAARHKAVCQS